MKRDELESLGDDELRAIVKTAGVILERREEERRQKAIEEAREKLAGVGLTFKDVAATAGKRKRGRKARPRYEKGARYVNPENPEEEWVAGRGRPPRWVAELAERDALPSPS